MINYLEFFGSETEPPRDLREADPKDPETQRPRDPRDPENPDTQRATISSPEAALLLVSTKNRDLWPGPTPKVRDSRTSRHSAHVQSQV